MLERKTPPKHDELMPERLQYAFGQSEIRQPADSIPLAARMRPRSFEEFVGQSHILSPKSFLRRAIEADRVPSCILWGPPGVGKTTLAQMVAEYTNAHFAKLSAVNSGLQDVRQVLQAAQRRLQETGQRTILFLDEIHRFSKSQQDSLLPAVENGTIILIGATTENPSFEVIGALLSRTRVFVLNPLTEDELKQIIERAAKVLFEGGEAALTPDAMEWLLTYANGDARVAINTLEAAHHSTKGQTISLELLKQLLSSQSTHYKGGENHYDLISAFIKSVRASSPDAALYYLARMLAGGEDPLFIARRIVILASEDVGLADPAALPLAVAAQQAVSFIGLPEARITLAEATIYLATAPKSNSAINGIDQAMQSALATPNAPVPLNVRNAPTKLMKNLGYGKGYVYPHNHANNYAGDKDLLPEQVAGKKYYTPGDNPSEQAMVERLRAWRKELEQNKRS